MSPLARPLCLALALSLSLPVFSGAVPQVTRTLAATRVAPGSVVKAELCVSLGTEEEVPEAWILEERWPSSCQILAAFWNGRPFAPAPRPQGYAWLFGYPGEEWAVEEGTLTYLLQTPALSPEETQATLAVEGLASTWEESTTTRGDDTLTLTPEADLLESPLFLLPLQPGWNLLSLPAKMEPRGLQELTRNAPVYLCRTENGDGLFYQGTIPETPGQPFWLREEGAFPRDVLLVAQESPASRLVPAGRWRQGGNLAGVSGTLPIPCHDAAKIWQWQEDQYTPKNDPALRPGQAAWLLY
ncbi:MAG: hypothetical protein ACI4SG_06330 [Oligosphaeraceae bacterium]